MRRLAFQVGPDGKAKPQYYLPFLVDTLGGALVQISLNAGTVLDTAATVADNGYQAELAVDLTKLGFPSGLGDGTLMMGIMLHDGDSFVPSPTAIPRAPGGSGSTTARTARRGAISIRT